MIGDHVPYGWLPTWGRPIGALESGQRARCSIAHRGAPAFDGTEIIPARYLSKIAPYQAGAPCI